MVYEYKLVASCEKLICESIKSSYNVIFDLIDKFFNSLTLTIFILFDYQIWSKLKEAVKRRVNVKIFIYERHDDNYKGIVDEVVEYLVCPSNYLKVHKTNEYYIHSKVIISDRFKVYFGSANPPQNGLNENYVLRIVVIDKNSAFYLEKIIKKLIL